MVYGIELSSEVAEWFLRGRQIDFDGQSCHDSGLPADDALQASGDPRFANPHTERFTLMLRGWEMFDAALHAATGWTEGQHGRFLY